MINFRDSVTTQHLIKPFFFTITAILAGLSVIILTERFHENSLLFIGIVILIILSLICNKNKVKLQLAIWTAIAIYLAVAIIAISIGSKDNISTTSKNEQPQYPAQTLPNPQTSSSGDNRESTIIDNNILLGKDIKVNFIPLKKTFTLLKVPAEVDETQPGQAVSVNVVEKEKTFVPMKPPPPIDNTMPGKNVKINKPN